MSWFRDALPPAPSARNRLRWVYIHVDQMTDDCGPLSTAVAGETGIVLIESAAFLRRRPYHRMKLALLLANQRAFALEQSRRGIAVAYRQTDAPHGVALAEVVRELGQLAMMEAAERETRRELQPLVESGGILVLPNELWLTAREDFLSPHGAEPPYFMDTFYKHVRRQTGILMEGGKPLGGKFSLDGDNRKPWPGDPAPPVPPRFTDDPLRAEVRDLIESKFADHPGALDMAAIPATRADADAAWRWAMTECLHHFGDFEDAMTTASSGLFHTRVSPLMNIGRLEPRRMIDDVVALEIPLNSKEGFIRQVIGWREYVRHVHRETDGFRHPFAGGAPTAASPGDGGYARWAGKEWHRPPDDAGIDGGATPNHFGAQTPLPPAWWGAKSGLNCLDTVVADLWREGWSHHITRLMVLSNIATLLDVSPRELTDWFWVAYLDAWDWVVEPNVLGMGTFALGGLFMTKPYVSGSAYIDKMSDYCADCRFDPAKNCPIKRLYWAFLDRHREILLPNPRLMMPLNSARKRSDTDKCRDRETFQKTRDALVSGGELWP